MLVGLPLNKNCGSREEVLQIRQQRKMMQMQQLQQQQQIQGQ